MIRAFPPFRFPGFRFLAFAALLAQAATGGVSGPATVGSAYGLLWLDIDSEQADIALDGLYLDRDVWLISIAPGAHEILVRKAGFKPYRNRFGIDGGQNLHLAVHLEPGGDSLAHDPGF